MHNDDDLPSAPRRTAARALSSRVRNRRVRRGQGIAEDPRSLQLADACYEMYSLRELQDISAVVEDLAPLLVEVGPGALLKAVRLALSWKAIESGGLSNVH